MCLWCCSRANGEEVREGLIFTVSLETLTSEGRRETMSGRERKKRRQAEVGRAPVISALR